MFLIKKIIKPHKKKLDFFQPKFRLYKMIFLLEFSKVYDQYK